MGVGDCDGGGGRGREGWRVPFFFFFFFLPLGVEHPGVRLVHPHELGLALAHVDHPSWDKELLIPALPSYGSILFIIRSAKHW
jgi:hypothetical protein